METKLTGIDSSVLQELIFETIIHESKVVDTTESVKTILSLIPFMDRQPYTREEMSEFLLDNLVSERFLTSRQIRNILNIRLSWKKQLDSKQIVFFIRRIQNKFPIESIVNRDRCISWGAKILI